MACVSLGPRAEKRGISVTKRGQVEKDTAQYEIWKEGEK